MIIEAAMAITLVCASTTRKQDSEFLVDSKTGPRIIQITSGKTLEGDVRNKIQGLANVGGVTVKRNGNVVSVDVEMSKFDKTSRRSVYAIERELAGQYPNHSLDVRLVDRSPENQLRDAIEE